MEPGPNHYRRLSDLLNALRRAILALIAGVALVGIGAAFSAWTFIPAALSLIFASVDAYLVWHATRAEQIGEINALVRGAPIRVHDVHAHEYGVDQEVLPSGQAWLHIERDFEHRFCQAVEHALAGTGPMLVMLSGPTKAGKTRAAINTLRHGSLRDAWLVEPQDGASVMPLINHAPREWTPLVILLDDIERYAAADKSGLSASALRGYRCARPVVLLATEGGRGQQRYVNNSDLVDPVNRLRNVARLIEVPVLPSQSELDRIRSSYGDRFACEARELGLGRRMVAVDEIRRKLATGRHYATSEPCREGIAVMRAAVDWRRSGAQSALSADQMKALYVRYLPGDLDASDELFASGLGWARIPLKDTSISLLTKTSGDLPGFEPYDLSVEVAASLWTVPNDEERTQMAELCSPLDAFRVGNVAYSEGRLTLAQTTLIRATTSTDEILNGIALTNLGVVLNRKGDEQGAEDAYRRADNLGNGGASYNLATLLRAQGKIEEAEAAYRRADERGSGIGAHDFGVFLQSQGRLEEAAAAFRRAFDRGSTASMSALGALSHEEGKFDEAEAAYRCADELGNSDGAYNLGMLLYERGDLKEAQAAFQRAYERGDGGGAYGLGLLLNAQNRVKEAVAAYGRADKLGNSHGTYNLGLLLHEQGHLGEAEAAFQRADERGNGKAALELGRLLEKRGKVEDAEAAFQRADERGSGAAANALGMLLLTRNKVEEAEAAFRRADERGSGRGTHNLGVLLEEQGNIGEAEAAYRRADEREDGPGASALGGLLQEQGRVEEAEAAYRRADERGYAAGAHNLGVLLLLQDKYEAAEAAFQRADKRGDARAAFNLGVLLLAQHKHKEAEAAFRRADERGDARGAHNLGVLLHQQGKIEQAEAAFRRADERSNSSGSEPQLDA